MERRHGIAHADHRLRRRFRCERLSFAASELVHVRASRCSPAWFLTFVDVASSLLASCLPVR